jgi:hypothetical protein
VPKRERERRPSGDYFLPRGSEHQLFRQGDLFEEVAFSFPFPPDAIGMREGKRVFLSGSFETGHALLLTPSCTMEAQGVEEPGYALPERTLAPIRPIEDLRARGVGEDQIGFIRKYDGIINYFYIPPSEELGVPESLALLYAPLTVHHDSIDQERVAQMTNEARIWLRRKLAAYSSGVMPPASLFNG